MALKYITLAQAKTWLGIEASDTTKDTLVTEIGEAVEEAIDAWTDTRFDGVQTVTNELHDARRQDILIPLEGPIVAVTAVRLNVTSNGTGGTVLDALGYRHDDVEIALLNTTPPQQRGYVGLDYTWGYSSIPKRVILATKLSVEAYYRLRANKAVGGMTSRSKEGESVSYGKNWDNEAGLPKEATSLLFEFRRIDFDMGQGTAMATRNS